MAETTGISWCDATWSPWEGCTKVSPGCDHCYAEGMNRWLRKGENWGPGAPRREYSEEHWQKPLRWNAKAAKEGKRLRVFPSVCDPFDNEAPAGWRSRFYELCNATPHLSWLLLTKRIGNVKAMAGQGPFTTLPNVWLGATVVNQEEADRDVPKLLAVPARVRFLSIEPMLGPVNLGRWLWECCGSYQHGYESDGRPGQDVCCNRPEASGLLDWIIAGGESGPHSRAIPVQWLRGIVEQGKAAGVAVHVKQLGAQPRGWCAGRVHAEPEDDLDDDFCDFYEAHEQGAPCPGRCAALVHPKGGDPAEWPEDLRVQEFPRIEQERKAA